MIKEAGGWNFEFAVDEKVMKRTHSVLKCF